MSRTTLYHCPWCGRTTTLTRAGILPRHKRVTGRDGTRVTRAWCRGSTQSPMLLCEAERRTLRRTWRDKTGRPVPVAADTEGVSCG